ncbi:MAG TPA: 4-hydroxythreonine-4-phosphate dehydrogenase PdxA [Alphaproteobacteria bacterium]|nr:4-hydroxythreonine-4-phosphate dehydrogenase PdxA [Alphaproteobacteria bacterium]
MPPKPLCLTMGEPAGIGGEIALRAWSLREERGLPPFFLIDDPGRLLRLAAAIGQPGLPLAEIAAPEEAETVFAAGLPILPLAAKVDAVPGRLNPSNAAAVIESIERGYALVAEGRASALVTNPIQKSVLYRAGFSHPGHTEFLAALAGGIEPVMMLVIEGLRVVPVTVHMALKDALDALTTEMIVSKTRITATALRDAFGIARPRLAVAGVNPHAGEDGSLGREEIEIVEPAISILKGEGWNVFGPKSPDTMFHPRARATYDAAICHYHDQALIPLKAIDYEHGVNVTLGLPIVRTSPDHGTALDLAGTGKANPESLIAALKLAHRMTRGG